MNNLMKIKKLVGIGVLLALVVILQLISNYISFGPVNITLALIPLTMGAILYGPITGMVLGMAMGAIILVAPGTTFFLSFNVGLTVLLCLVKTGVAGLIAGLIFNGITAIKVDQKYKNPKFATSIITSALITPILNTGIFILGATFMFTNLYSESGNLGEAFSLVIAATFTTNFLIEFLVSAICSPALVYLVKVLAHQSNLGFQNKFDLYIEDKKEEITFADVDSDKLFK